jgi:DNA (cytosine-5)-methyltransferase 1
MTAFGQYEGDDSGSTCKQRDYKDATDLVVQPMNVTQDTVAGPLDSHYWKGPGSRQGGEREYVGVVQPVCATGERTHALTVSDGATEDDTGRGTPIVPAIAFHPTQDPIHSVEVTHAKTRPVDGSVGGTGNGEGCATVAVAIPMAFNGYQRTIDDVTWPLGTQTGGIGGGVGGILAPTLTASNDPSRSPQSTEVTQQVAAVLAAQPTMAVRRLLPVECEALQGFPLGWTDIPWKGKPAPDGPRYKAMGNSMAVPVMRWIGQRLDRVAKGLA